MTSSAVEQDTKEYLIDEDASFLSLIHFLHFYSPLLPDLDSQFCLGNSQDFSPVHLRHFFLYCAEERLLTRPFFVFLKWINQRLPHPSIFKCLQREYRRREIEQPPFLEELGEDALIVTLGIEQRVRLMHDLVCVFVPWNGDVFRELCGNKEYPPEHSRIEPLKDVYVIADRFLYEKQQHKESTKWILLSYDKVSWESFFSDTDRNSFLKSRKPAAKAALAQLRKLLPSVLEYCKFDEQCHRELELRQLQESRKRSPRITQRSARREALERLRSSETAAKPKPPSEDFMIPQKRSREERMAKREQLKVMQQLQITNIKDEFTRTPQSDYYSEGSESDYFYVDDDQLMSSSQQYDSDEDSEDEFINVTKTSSPIKKVILRFEPTITAQDGKIVDTQPPQTNDVNKEDQNQMMDALLQAAASSDPIPDSLPDPMPHQQHQNQPSTE